MYRIFNKATKRFLKQTYATYEQARKAAIKRIRQGKHGTYWAFDGYPTLGAFNLAVKPA